MSGAHLDLRWLDCCIVSEYKAAKGDRKFFATCRDPQLVSELTIQVHGQEFFK